MPFCTTLPNLIQIGLPTAEKWRHIDFQDGGRQPCWICLEVMANHPRSVLFGLNSILKSPVAQINIGPSSGDTAMDINGVLAWKCLFTPLVGGVSMAYSPYDVTYRAYSKRTVLVGRNTSCMWAISVMKRKGQDNQKVRKTSLSRFGPKSAWLHGGCSPWRNHVCLVSSWRGYDFTGGRIFDFPIDFCKAFLTTVQRCLYDWRREGIIGPVQHLHQDSLIITIIKNSEKQNLNLFV